MAARKKATRKKATRKTTARKATRKTVTRKAATKRKTTAKRGAKKATAKRKPAARKKAPAAKKVAATAAQAAIPSRVVGVKDPYSKSELVNKLTEYSGVAKKEVKNVLDSLEYIISCHVKKGAAGIFNMPGLFKIQVVRKPATKARKGINPFTGEPTIFKAKPARNVVKVRPLKKLKEMVN